MKAYLNAIEQILGLELEREAIQHYDFSPGPLKALHEFASGYAKKKIILPDRDPKITCFFPFPDILSGNFRTYNSNGALLGHWPAFEELANMVMLCERFIIHDHLEHYAGSAIDGYVEKYRYAGLRNWLLALAAWKPLILEEIICIIPQDLACSGPFQTLQDEGELSGTASGLYYAMHPEAGNFSSGSDAEELLSAFVEMEDFLTTLSIPVNSGGKFAPFYNNINSLWLHEAVVEASLKIFRREAIIKGDYLPFSKEMMEPGIIARLNLDAVLLPSAYNAADVCRFRLEDQDFDAIRADARMAVRKFSENSAFLMSPDQEFQHYLDSLQVKHNKKIKKFFISSSSEKNPCKQIAIGFGGMMAGRKTDSHLTGPLVALRSIFNNLPVRAQLPSSICHYFLSITDKNVKAQSPFRINIDWL